MFWAFLETQIVQQCVKIVFLQNLGDVKNEVFEKKIAFFVFLLFYVGEIETEKRKKKKMEKAKKPYNFFLRWSSKNVKKPKNGFLAKIAWHYLCQEGRKNAHFRAHYLFWPKIFLGPKQRKSGKTIKIVVSAEIAQNQKWHLFFEKGVFFKMGEKVGFTSCVFEKLCFFFLKTLFL